MIMNFKALAVIGAFAVTPFAAMAQASVFNADKVTFCSDGEFDWISGQSLYDFVLLSKDDGTFLISYLGIPHPSFEKRKFDNAWMKMKGYFSAKLLTPQNAKAKRYELTLDVEGPVVHKGRLDIDEKGNYTYQVTPKLPLEYVTSTGLCWDSLSDEPDAIRRKMNRRR